MSLGIGLDPGEPARQQRETLERLRVAVGMRLERADPFDAVVDGAHAGGEEQPLGRVDGRRGVEDDRPRHDVRVAEQLLGAGAFVGDAGDCAELAARQGRRDGDLGHGRWIDGRRAERPVRAGHRSEHVDPIRLADVVREAERDRLGAVGDRATPEGDDEVRPGLPRGIGGRDHVRARGVRRHPVELAHDLVAERAAKLRDLVGLAVEGAAHHQEHALRAPALDFGRHRLGERPAEGDRFHRSECHASG